MQLLELERNLLALGGQLDTGQKAGATLPESLNDMRKGNRKFSQIKRLTSQLVP
jgi:hypothetical protein